MKKYRHKRSGNIVERKDKDVWYYPVHPSWCGPISSWLIDGSDDWEEIEETPKQPEVPPGIVAFADMAGNKHYYQVPKHVATYEDWVNGQMIACKNTIHTISVNGVEWSVGEVVGTKYNSDKNVIQRFTYSGGGDLRYWAVFYTDGGCDHLTRCVKLPTRKPIVTLQGKELFEGDVYHHVNKHFEIIPLVCQSYDHSYQYTNTCFLTRELAEEYVRDNKPAVPWGLVWGYICNSDPLTQNGRELRDKLKAFKP